MAGAPMSSFHGLPIRTSLMMTEAGDPVEVPRTLRERWLSRPWRPWQRTKTIVPQVPSKTAYRTPFAIWMHPVMLGQLSRELRAERKDD